MDGSLVVLSLFDVAVSLSAVQGQRNSLGILRVFRLLRTLRPLRSVSATLPSSELSSYYVLTTFDEISHRYQTTVLTVTFIRVSLNFGYFTAQFFRPIVSEPLVFSK